MEQCVMTAGTMKMPQSSAHNLDSLNMVHKIHVDDVEMCFAGVFTYLCAHYIVLLTIILQIQFVVVKC